MLQGSSLALSNARRVADVAEGRAFFDAVPLSGSPGALFVGSILSGTSVAAFGVGEGESGGIEDFSSSSSEGEVRGALGSSEDCDSDTKVHFSVAVCTLVY